MGLGFFKTAWDWIVKSPWYVRLYLGVVVLPNFLLNVILFVLFLTPFIRGEIHAYVEPLREKRDTQITHMLESQKLRDQAIMDTLNRLDRHQSIMFQAMQTRQNP